MNNLVAGTHMHAYMYKGRSAWEGGTNALSHTLDILTGFDTFVWILWCVLQLLAFMITVIISTRVTVYLHYYV